MRRLARTAALLVAALAALAVAGCNKEEQVSFAETEGIYVTVDDLKYQIQISRILNPAAVEDGRTWPGCRRARSSAEDEVWYGIFMRVENDTEEPHAIGRPSDDRGHAGATTFEPMDRPVDEPVRLRPPRDPAGKVDPVLTRPPSDNTIRGAHAALQGPGRRALQPPARAPDRDPEGGENGMIDLDI